MSAEGKPMAGAWRALAACWVPHYFATRPGPFTLHGSRLVVTVSKGISNGGWSYEKRN
jgi:hypothetical protein